MDNKITLKDGTSARTVVFSETLLVPDNSTVFIECEVNKVPLRVEIKCTTTMVINDAQIKWEWRDDHSFGNALAKELGATIEHPEQRTLTMNHCAFASLEPTSLPALQYLGIYNDDSLGFQLTFYVAMFTHVLHIQFLRGGNY